MYVYLLACTAIILRSVTEWFDEEGTLVNNKFESDFKKLCEDTRASDKTQ